jgi:hypothetical protein
MHTLDQAKLDLHHPSILPLNTFLRHPVLTDLARRYTRLTVSS